MRYRVEYWTAEDENICVSIEAECDLVSAAWFARARGADARKRYKAEGFQIRDLSDSGRIVVLESFNDPLSRFDPGDKVIH